MRTAAGILFIVIAVWVGLEVFTNGTRGAFGGALVRYLPASMTANEPEGAPMDRIGSKLRDAREERDERAYRASSDPAEQAAE